MSFINTLEKGKESDRTSHNAFLKHVNNWCAESGLVDVSSMKFKCTRADHRGNQLKYCFNFAQLRLNSSSSAEKVHEFV